LSCLRFDLSVLYVDSSLGFSRVRTECNFSLVDINIAIRVDELGNNPAEIRICQIIAIYFQTSRRKVSNWNHATSQTITFKKSNSSKRQGASIISFILLEFCLIGVPNQGPKSGSQIGVPNRGPKWGCPKSRTKIRVQNQGPKSGSKIGVPNGGPKSGS
jgi:hypothetical protein